MKPIFPPNYTLRDDDRERRCADCDALYHYPKPCVHTVKGDHMLFFARAFLTTVAVMLLIMAGGLYMAKQEAGSIGLIVIASSILGIVVASAERTIENLAQARDIEKKKLEDWRNLGWRLEAAEEKAYHDQLAKLAELVNHDTPRSAS